MSKSAQNRVMLGAVTKSRSFSLGAVSGAKALNALGSQTQRGSNATAYRGVVCLGGGGSSAC